jgi:atypical dual specificity phosphatase
MSLRTLPLPAGVPGRLWLHGMPARAESWEEFLALARAAALTRIVCLTPLGEIAARSPEYLLAIERDELPCPIDMLTMADFGVSDDAAAFQRQVLALAERLRGGESMLVHCAWGIGRTGTVAACLLKALGLDTESALAAVRAAGSNPQSAVQSGWVEQF